MKNVFIISVFLVIALNIIDFGMTSQALASGNYREMNPVARLYLGSPAISIPVVSFGNYGVGSALVSLHSKSKPLAFIMAGLLIVGHSFVIAHNVKVLR